MRFLFFVTSLMACGGALYTDSSREGGVDGSAGDGGSTSDGGAVDGARDVKSDTRGVCFGDAPVVDKGCTSSASCAIGRHVIDCCGTALAVGINQSQQSVFDAKEMATQAGCPMCDCPPSPTKTESGMTCAMPAVRCDVGKCTTFCP